MTDLRKAAELALEYLEYLNELDIAGLDHEVHTNALRQALAQSEHPLDKKADNARELGLDYESEQEPVAWVERDGELIWHDINAAIGKNLYTTPPKREFVGLTDEEISLMAHNDDDNDWDDLNHKYVWHEGYLEGARAAETELREKNG